jgi:antitoxin MazE
MYIMEKIYWSLDMQVAKWGNSLAVRLPKSLVDQLGLKVGDDLAVLSASASTLEVEKRDQRMAAIAELCEFRFKIPPNYSFDRDEANAR